LCESFEQDLLLNVFEPSTVLAAFLVLQSRSFHRRIVALR